MYMIGSQCEGLSVFPAVNRELLPSLYPVCSLGHGVFIANKLAFAFSTEYLGKGRHGGGGE